MQKNNNISIFPYLRNVAVKKTKSINATNDAQQIMLYITFMQQASHNTVFMYIMLIWKISAR